MALELNRLFFALWPPDPVRESLAAAARQLRIRLSPDGRATPAERLHLTLLFLGSTVSPASEQLARRAAAGVRVAPFTLLLDQAASFRQRRHLWWLGARDPAAGVQLLHEGLREALAGSDIVAPRGRFTPHVTIMRDATSPLAVTPVAPIRWTVDDFVLVRSQLAQAGGGYEVVDRWPLRADSPESQPQMTLPL